MEIKNVGKIAIDKSIPGPSKFFILGLGSDTP